MSRLRTATLVHEGGMRFVATTGSTRTIVYGDAFAARTSSARSRRSSSASRPAARWTSIAIALKKRQEIDRYVGPRRGRASATSTPRS